jgi:alcohol dehydrogenase (cytochrome c)
MSRAGSFRIVAALAGSLCLAGCSLPHRERAGEETGMEPPPAATPAEDWAGYNNTLSSERYSPLKEINSSNVGRLSRRCVFDLGEPSNFQSGPVVIDGIAYVTTEKNTYAFDAANCRSRWKHSYQFNAPPGSLGVNRGVAYANGRLFRGVDAGALIALDAATGVQVWEAKAAEPGQGESLPAAPIAWDGLVFIGNAGGDKAGVTGHMMAFDVRDGRRVWSFDLVPPDDDTGQSWPESTPERPRSGGATWVSYSLDAANGLLYIPTGNPAPDFAIELRPGSNVYTNSIVVLDARTGAFRGWYPLTPLDFHDWDVATAPVLARTARGRRMALEAGKDGLLHGIDLDAGKVVFRTPITTRDNTEMPITAGGTRFCPGTQGGAEWNGPAFHPTLNTVFVNAVDWCFTVRKLDPVPPAEAGKSYSGAPADAPFGTPDPKEQWRGWLTAIDADSGEVRWKYQSPTPLLSGVTATAGGLVFTGDLNGDLLAFAADDGKVLYRHAIGQPIGGGIVSYSAHGKQYVAVTSGLTAALWQLQSPVSQVTVFSLP